MTSEEQVLKKRFMELARRADSNYHFTYTAFLSPVEIDVFYQMLPELNFVSYEIFGGSENSERQVIRFCPEGFSNQEEPFQITLIMVKPQIYKFADELTHRDFLGALMNLGIERDVIGDILVKDKVGYIFCGSQMADYIIENLDKVKHTVVRCSKLDELPHAIKPELKEEKIIVSSMRCDSIIAKVYNLSRSQSLELFREKKVFVNGRNVENNGMMLKDGDVVSVRGFGKFISHDSLYETKKGKLGVMVEKYV